MTFDADVLRAMLRLARRREAADDEPLAIRVGAPVTRVRSALRRLQSSGLVDLQEARAPRLTMQGFAVAIALISARATPAKRGVSRAPRAA
jgi:predicted transcriptional regulator